MRYQLPWPAISSIKVCEVGLLHVGRGIPCRGLSAAFRGGHTTCFVIKPYRARYRAFVVDYLCAMFGYFSFSHFDFSVRLESQNCRGQVVLYRTTCRGS